MDDWTRALPAIQFIFNTTKHRDIGYSSADLLFGPAVNINRFVMEHKEPDPTLEPIAWWDQQQEIHFDIMNKAALLQKEVDDRRREQRTKLPTEYKVHSYVLVEYPKTMGEGRGRPLNKLQTTRKGPMKVMEVRDDAYDLLDLVNRKVDTIHVARLHPFIYDPSMVDPENVAIRDQGEFIVQEIVDALIDHNLPKTEWSFKVRWAGYDESFDEWLDSITKDKNLFTAIIVDKMVNEKDLHSLSLYQNFYAGTKLIPDIDNEYRTEYYENGGGAG
jgi:hypothetical protein